MTNKEKDGWKEVSKDQLETVVASLSEKKKEKTIKNDGVKVDHRLKNLSKRKKFSSTYQPVKNGRRANILKLLDAEASAKFGVELSKNDKYMIIDSLLEKSISELRKIKNDETCPAFVVSVATAILFDIFNGVTPTVQMIFDRMYGKPTQPSEISGPEGAPVKIASNSADAKLVEQIFGVVVEDDNINAKSD